MKRPSNSYPTFQPKKMWDETILDKLRTDTALNLRFQYGNDFNNLRDVLRCPEIVSDSMFESSLRQEKALKAAQGELSVPDPLHEKDMVLAGNGFGFVAAPLAWRHAARLLEPPNPIDHRPGSDAKAGRPPMPR
jgi:hypothetical protein